MARPPAVPNLIRVTFSAPFPQMLYTECTSCHQQQVMLQHVLGMHCLRHILMLQTFSNILYLACAI